MSSFDPLARLRHRPLAPLDYHPPPAEDADETAITPDPDQGRKSDPPPLTMNQLIRWAATGDPRALRR